MVEEDEAKANAAEILQPLYKMLETSQLESGPGHSGAGPEVGKQLEGSARQAREAQMEDLKHKTGDVLYPSAGEHSSISCFQCIGVHHRLLCLPTRTGFAHDGLMVNSVNEHCAMAVYQESRSLHVRSQATRPGTQNQLSCSCSSACYIEQRLVLYQQFRSCDITTVRTNCSE